MRQVHDRDGLNGYLPVDSLWVRARDEVYPRANFIPFGMFQDRDDSRVKKLSQVEIPKKYVTPWWILFQGEFYSKVEFNPGVGVGQYIVFMSLCSTLTLTLGFQPRVNFIPGGMFQDKGDARVKFYPR